jgi:hypothetical protein
MNTKYKSRLLCRPEEDALVRSDIFVRPEPDTLEMLREALEQGLKPIFFAIYGDTVMLRLEKE